MAVLGSPELRAETVDAATVAFGPAGARVRQAAGVADVNGDGVGDAVLIFDIAETGIKCGDTEASLTGATSEAGTVRRQGHGGDGGV